MHESDGLWQLERGSDEKQNIGNIWRLQFTANHPKTSHQLNYDASPQPRVAQYTKALSSAACDHHSIIEIGDRAINIFEALQPAPLSMIGDL